MLTETDTAVTFDALTYSERGVLIECEATIERGQKTFVLVGEALRTIRDQRLYRASHGTFEAYLGERWHTSKTRAYEMIQAADVMADLSAIADVSMPANEAQVRPLAQVDPEHREEAWRVAVASAPEGKVTARHVEAAVGAMHATDHIVESTEMIAPDTEDDRAAALFAGMRAKSERVTASPVDVPASDEGASYSGDDWHTPAHVLDLVRQVIGPIDLDPASNARANEIVQAARYFSRADDGLSQDWTAPSIFLNPPYQRGIVDRFVNTLIGRYWAGDFEQAILLVNASTDSGWFSELFDFPICFWRGRLRFEAGDEHGGDRATGMPARTGSALVYIGDKAAKFRDVFEPYGAIVTRLLD